MTSTQKLRLSYKGLENLSKSDDDRPTLVRFQVLNSATGEPIVDFYTNKVLEGVFVYDHGAASYRQIIGTKGFRVPPEKNAARRALRRLALASMADFTHTHAPIRAQRS